MKRIIACGVILVGILSCGLVAQTNVFSTVMVDGDGEIYRPTNFWTANATGILTVAAPTEKFADLLYKTRFSTSFVGAQTALSNVNTGVEPAWTQLWTPGTNASAEGRILLMRYVLGNENTGGGIRFGTYNVKAIFDVSANTATTNNIARIVLGTTLADYGRPLTTRGVGVEIRNNSGANEVRLLAHNGTNSNASGWVSLGNLERMFLIVEAKTNGIVNLLASLSSGGSAPTFRTNISGGPTTIASTGESNLGAGLFINSTNATSRSIVIYAAAIQADY